jgi:hypothetical protein
MLVPVLGGLRPFAAARAPKDALAGLMLASMNISRVLSCTRIAGTPIVSGLYTVLLPLVGFGLFGSSRHRRGGRLSHCGNGTPIPSLVRQIEVGELRATVGRNSRSMKS